MKKIIYILSLGISVIVLANVVAFLLNICPPQGPWIMPPWCKADVSEIKKIEQRADANILKSPQKPAKSAQHKTSKEATSKLARKNSGNTASIKTKKNQNQNSIPQQKVESQTQKQPVQQTQKQPEQNIPKYKTLPEYITPYNAKLSNGFVRGVGMMDLWGKLCSGLFNCHNPRNYVQSSFTRLRDLHANMVMVTDFYQLNNQAKILPVTNGGARTISKSDMSYLVNQAHKNGLKFMLITNLYSKDNARQVLNLKKPTMSEAENLYSQWKQVILEVARKGKYDYLVINPRDIGFFFENSEAMNYMNNKYEHDLLPELRKVYSGKVCIWGFKGTLRNIANKYDCVVLDQDINEVVGSVSENVGSITNAWARHLSGVYYSKPTFVLLLMPSYNGAMQRGWIEPVGARYGSNYKRDDKEQALVYEGLLRAVAAHKNINGIISYGYWWNDDLYPNTLSLFRNDLSHSVRDKDAEAVLYHWFSR